MKANVFQGKNKIRVEEVEKPRAGVGEADEAVERVRDDELSGGTGAGRRWGRGWCSVVEGETSFARARRARRFECQVVAIFRGQHRIARGIAFDDRQVNGVQHDAAADARLAGHGPFNEHAVAQ